MNLPSPVWLLLLAAFLPGAVPAEEYNAWPFLVTEETPAAGQPVVEQRLGPVLYQRVDPDGRRIEAFRPIFLLTTQGAQETGHLLYPLLTWHRSATGTSFSVFSLMNDRRQAAAGSRPAEHGFDLWPVYFSRSTGDPATSYRAVFPLGGTIRNRFGYERLTWALFPLTLQTEKQGRRITSAPWPFVRVIDGNGHRGFELWPLFGERRRDGDYREDFFLWPLCYRHVSGLGNPEPEVKIGVLPLYAAERGPGYRNETFLWPFFGAMHRTQPARYDEIRYLWPFLVQGRGEDRTVNRWGPIYTHSVIKGYDKTWFLWPVLRHAQWREGGLDQTQIRLLYFLYWSLEQRDPLRPAAAPAVKQHLWPLYSRWDNGAGRRQFQLFSPFEVFFTHNEPVRQLYSPLFALYRSEQLAPGDRRGTLLWGLLTWHRAPGEREFHLGPLFSRHTRAGAARVAVGHGLLSWRRDPGSRRWRFSLFDFRPLASVPAAPGTPTP